MPALLCANRAKTRCNRVWVILGSFLGHSWVIFWVIFSANSHSMNTYAERLTIGEKVGINKCIESKRSKQNDSRTIPIRIFYDRRLHRSEGILNMENYFPTLNAALESESLIDLWPIGTNLNYGETIAFASNGRWIVVYRDDKGRYERPIHYATLMADTCPIHLS